MRKMNTDNLITLGVGILLFTTGFILKKRTGTYDWLYVILGAIIIIIGFLRIGGFVRI